MIQTRFFDYQTDLSKAEAPRRSLIMSLVKSNVGPTRVKQIVYHKKVKNLCVCLSTCFNLKTQLHRSQAIPLKKGFLRTKLKCVGLPMALSAWLSSRLNALIGTSSQTGSTATVERLLAGLVTSALVVMLGRLRAEPKRLKQ